MAATDPGRAADERLLAWIAARRGGVTAGAIARAYGTTEGTVRTMTRRVREADVAESGELERAVRAGYW